MANGNFPPPSRERLKNKTAFSFAVLLFIATVIFNSPGQALEQAPEAAAATPDTPQQVFYEVEEGVEADAETGRILTHGETRLWSGRFSLTASDMVIDLNEGWVKSPGLSILTMDKLTLQGPDLLFNWSENTARLGPWTGTYERYRFSGTDLEWKDRVLTFHDGSMTTCRGFKPAIALTARTCKWDMDRGISLKKVFLRFFGRRIFYLPLLNLGGATIGLGSRAEDEKLPAGRLRTSIYSGFTRRLGGELALKGVYPLNGVDSFGARIEYFTRIGQPLFSESFQHNQGSWGVKLWAGRVKVRDEFYEPYVISARPEATVDWRRKFQKAELGLRFGGGRFYERETGSRDDKMDSIAFVRGPAPVACRLLKMAAAMGQCYGELSWRHSKYGHNGVYRVFTSRIHALRLLPRDQYVGFGFTVKAAEGTSPFGFDLEDTKTRIDLQVRAMIKRGWFFQFNGEFYTSIWQEKKADWTLVRDWECLKLSLTWDNTNKMIRAGGDVFGYGF